MIDGFLFINKDRGLTSRKVCNQISFRFNEKKVGHIGTLDPFATGLLIVTLGKGNKAGQFLEKLDKSYIAELKLGTETSTSDNTGEIVLQRTIPSLDNDKINLVFKEFIGEILQVPPMTSAIHVNGVKLYKLAHKGIEVSREPRKVNVKNLKLISYKNNVIKFECTVSSGTYIRVLAKDIAEALGSVGHLISLERTKVGNISINDSVTVDKSTTNDIKKISLVLETVSEKLMLDAKKIEDIKNGKIEFISHHSDINNLLIVNNNNDPIAMYVRIDVDKYQFKRGLF